VAKRHKAAAPSRRITLLLEPGLMRRLRAAAKRSGRSGQSLITDLIDAHLRKDNTGYTVQQVCRLLRAELERLAR